MTTSEAKLVREPTIFVLAEMLIASDAYKHMLTWLEEYAPECLDVVDPSVRLGASYPSRFSRIFPHGLEAERCDFAADLEIQRFACKLRDLCYARWPNLFMASNPACAKGG